ncbi:MAG: efflux RND transporter periplasmic adaptor subunit [Phyllobacteriaceae bacterium]|nr:efflux RND transporter periplasmic adaptor subunit [Phyllobacteriaceae bacterium]
MASWKQLLIIAALGLVCLLAWTRIDPGAGDRLQAWGLDPALARRITGTDASATTGSVGGAGGQSGGGQRAGVLVVTAPVFTASIDNSVTAIGDGEASRSITLVPLEAGVLTAVNVTPGDRVKAGDVVAELDSDTERIARDRAALQERLAADKVARMEQLTRSRTASAVQLDDAMGELETARLALRDAEVALQRRRIVAPADGIAGLVPVEMGAYVTTQTAITTIDDRSSLIVDFWVPERFAALVGVGDRIEAEAVAFPGRPFEGTVSQIASRVDRDSRTLQIRGRIPNAEDRLRPGMSFRVSMRFPGERHVAVDPLAIQWSSQGPYVWIVADNKAKRLDVRIIQRNSDAVMVEADLKPGDVTIIEGVQSVREGAALNITSQPSAGGA